MTDVDKELQSLTKPALIQLLNELAVSEFDVERGHLRADDLLLAYINDAEITAAYEQIEKWYA